MRESCTLGSVRAKPNGCATRPSPIGRVADDLRKLDHRVVKRAYVIFDNCYQSLGITNVATMDPILRGSARDR